MADHGLITGASAGLGKALAFSLAKKGFNLSLCARRMDLLIKLKEELLEKYPSLKIEAIKMDVCQKESVEHGINLAVKTLGPLNLFIANAGQSMWTRFRDLKDPDDLKNLMQLNYMGVVYGAFYALPFLRKTRGSFVAISSLQGSLPVPYHSGYVASKFAVNGFIETIKMEEPDVHFLLALPSWIAGTELRSQALSSKGEHSVKVKTSHDAKVISAQDCADLVVEALIKCQDKIFIPKKYQAVSMARVFLPTLVDKIVKTKVDTQLKN